MTMNLLVYIILLFVVFKNETLAEERSIINATKGSHWKHEYLKGLAESEIARPNQRNIQDAKRSEKLVVVDIFHDNITKPGGEEAHNNCTTEEEEAVNRNIAKRVTDVIKNLGVTSFAMVVQCYNGIAMNSIIRELARASVPVCVFTSLKELVRGAMEHPDRAHCFAHRDWTVALIGTVEWSAGIVTEAKMEGLYDARVHWLVLTTGVELSVSPVLSAMSIHYRITWLKWSPRGNTWVVLVSEATERGIKARQAARWVKDGNGLKLETSRLLKPPYTNNFFHAQLRVISRMDTDKVETFNSVGRCYYLPSGRTSCIGYVGELLSDLATSLNMSINNWSVRSCGAPGVNGTRVTIIGNDEADIALGTCSITYDRAQVVDFSEFFNVVRASLMSAEPEIAETPFLIFNVLSWEAWSCVGVFVIFSTIVVWLVTRRLSEFSYEAEWSFLKSFTLVVKALLLQAHAHQPSTISARVVIGVSWLVIISLVSVYSGNLTAWLSLPRYDVPVNSLSELADRPDLIPLVRQNDPNHQMFINKTSGTLGTISKRLVVISRTSLLNISNIVHGKYVYMNSDRSHLATATDLNIHEGIQGFAPCRIHIGKQDVRQDYLGLMINKNSWFKEQMNRKIQWLRSYGIVNKLYWQYNPPGCRLAKPGRRSGIKERLNLAQLQGIFWVWLTGVVLAFVVLLAELALAFLTSHGTHRTWN